MSTVDGGQAVFGAPLARRLLTYFDIPRPLQPPGLFAELTEREQEILHLMAQGLDNQEIAGRLFISAKTVSNHAANICGKLQATDRVQAILMAREAGYK